MPATDATHPQRGVTHGSPRVSAMLEQVIAVQAVDGESLGVELLRYGSRLKLTHLVGEELERKKAESALKNYKLKVSRLATCFSMVASLSAEPVPVKPETVLELCRITPAERFERLRAHGNAADRLVDELLEVYAAFLANVQRREKELLDEFAVAATRRQAHADAKRYGDIIYSLLREVTPPERMRFLVI